MMPCQVYRDVAQRDGIPLDSAPHSVREFALTEFPGAYRHVLHRPIDLEVGGRGLG
jgi:tRNA pseudouridine13 synthase